MSTEKKKHIDINCDLGEWDARDPRPEQQLRDREIMPLISSVNIACGGHRGDAHSIRTTMEHAASLGLAIGLHPSFPDRENFGRKELPWSDEIAESIYNQLDFGRSLAREVGVQLNHVKPHGALYNMASRYENWAEKLWVLLRSWDSDMLVYGLSESEMSKGLGMDIMSVNRGQASHLRSEDSESDDESGSSSDREASVDAGVDAGAGSELDVRMDKGTEAEAQVGSEEGLGADGGLGSEGQAASEEGLGDEEVEAFWAFDVKTGNRFCAEAFADRAYTPNLTLVPRSRDGAVHTNPSFVMMQVQEMVVRGQVRCVDGVSRALKVESICLHSDTPGAVEMAQLISRGLKELNVEVRPCS